MQAVTQAHPGTDQVLDGIDRAEAICAAMPDQAPAMTPIIDRLHRELEAAHQREQRLSLVDQLRQQRAQRKGVGTARPAAHLRAAA